MLAQMQVWGADCNSDIIILQWFLHAEHRWDGHGRQGTKQRERELKTEGKFNVSWVTWDSDAKLTGLDAKWKRRATVYGYGKKKFKSMDLIFRFLLSFQVGTKQKWQLLLPTVFGTTKHQTMVGKSAPLLDHERIHSQNFEGWNLAFPLRGRSSSKRRTGRWKDFHLNQGTSPSCAMADKIHVSLTSRGVFRLFFAKLLGNRTFWMTAEYRQPEKEILKSFLQASVDFSVCRKQRSSFCTRNYANLLP